jgi:hypothetical protein
LLRVFLWNQGVFSRNTDSKLFDSRVKIIAHLSSEVGNGLLGPERRRKLWNVTVGWSRKLAEEQRESLYLVSIATYHLPDGAQESTEKMGPFHGLCG